MANICQMLPTVEKICSNNNVGKFRPNFVKHVGRRLSSDLFFLRKCWTWSSAQMLKSYRSERMTGTQKHPPSSFRRFVLDRIEAKFCTQLLNTHMNSYLVRKEDWGKGTWRETEKWKFEQKTVAITYILRELLFDIAQLSTARQESSWRDLRVTQLCTFWIQ